MITKFNRFAILPKMCNSCHRYIFLEKYRRADVYHGHAIHSPFWKENICKDCINKYN